MTVKELKEALETYEDEAHVYIMSQPNWPFEQLVSGIISREEMADDLPDEEPSKEDELSRDRHQKNPGLDRWSTSDMALPQTDVFIVEGPQTRYGNKSAWR